MFLAVSSLEKHYKARSGGKVVGVHSTAADLSSRWLAIDLDLHDEDNLSVTPEGNFAAAHGWWTKLVGLGFDPLLLDSNGAGGFHLLLLFAEPMDTRSVNAFAKQLVADYAQRGLDRKPDIFPNRPTRNHYGNWLRLPGRHHTRDHHTRVWNDEPWAEEKWLAGEDAIERILRTRLKPTKTSSRDLWFNRNSAPTVPNSKAQAEGLGIRSIAYSQGPTGRNVPVGDGPLGLAHCSTAR